MEKDRHLGANLTLLRLCRLTSIASFVRPLPPSLPVSLGSPHFPSSPPTGSPQSLYRKPPQPLWLPFRKPSHPRFPTPFRAVPSLSSNPTPILPTAPSPFLLSLFYPPPHGRTDNFYTARATLELSPKSSLTLCTSELELCTPPGLLYPRAWTLVRG